MAKKSRKRTRARVRYPKHSQLKPTDLLHFVYEDGFFDDCKEIGLKEEDVDALEYVFMLGGKDSPVIQGTGGLRKLRFAPDGWNVGKSGAVRVLFAYFEQFWIVYVLGTYAKSDYDNISEEAKRFYRNLIARAEAGLERRQRI